MIHAASLTVTALLTAGAVAVQRKVPDMENARRRGRDLLVPLAGIAGPVAMYGVMKFLTIRDPSQPTGILQIWPEAMVVFLLVGCIVGFRIVARPETGWRAWLVAYAGIAAGVILWIIVEETVFRRLGQYPVYQEHTLFPFEILLWWVIAAIPMATGIGLVRVLTTFLRRRARTDQ